MRPSRGGALRRVAVTAIGIVSPFGLGTGAARRGLAEGRDCSQTVRGLDSLGQRGARACQVPDEELERALGGRPPRWVDRSSRLLLAALDEALSSAGLPSSELADGRLVLGTTVGGLEKGMAYHREVLSGGAGRASALLDYLALSQPLSAFLRTGAGRRPLVVSNACASGTSALGLGFRLVRSGREPLVLAAGCDPMSAFTFWGFNALRLVTPERCRPFDTRRSGLLLGEGAAVLVLEEWERARERGARIYGEILGYGEANDAYHATHPQPQGEGAARAMGRALEDASRPASELGYVNAHGTGTRANDEAEASALRTVLGAAAETVPVSSTKGHVGHCLGAAGALEAAFTLIALREGLLPETVNLESPEPSFSLAFIRGAPLLRRCAFALSNSFGFGGMNASLALGTGEVRP